jgi:PIN domain nuclease of toxin-antitoxin system
MIQAVADTHAVIWYLSNDPRLSLNARQLMNRVEASSDHIGISSISLVEMVYLVEKGRIPPYRFTELTNILSEEGQFFIECSVNLRVARALSRVDAAQIPDMPDRIVAATALALNEPIISRDGRIRLSSLQTIW